MTMDEIEITQETYLALAEAVAEHAQRRDYISHTFCAQQDEADVRVTLCAVPRRNADGGFIGLSVIWWESNALVGDDTCTTDFSMGELINTIFG